VHQVGSELHVVVLVRYDVFVRDGLSLNVDYLLVRVTHAAQVLLRQAYTYISASIQLVLVNLECLFLRENVRKNALKLEEKRLLLWYVIKSCLLLLKVSLRTNF